MEISLNSTAVVTEWVDFNENSFRALQSLAEAVNERLYLVRKSHSYSDCMINVSQFDSLDYEVILKIQENIILIINDFCDLDFDFNSFDEYNTNNISFPKKITFSDFSDDVIKGFFDLPCKGSLTSSFENFYKSCRAILTKMVAIEHDEDVISLKCRYTSGCYIDRGFINGDSADLNNSWYSIMKQDTNNFQNTLWGSKYSENFIENHFFYCDILGGSNLIDVLGDYNSLEEAEQNLESIDKYQFWKKSIENLRLRTASPHLATKYFSSLDMEAFQKISDFSKKYFSEKNAEYIITSLEAGIFYRDGYAIQNGWLLFENCVNQLKDETTKLDGKNLANTIYGWFLELSYYTYGNCNVSELELPKFQKWKDVSSVFSKIYKAWDINNFRETDNYYPNSMEKYLTNNYFKASFRSPDFILSASTTVAQLRNALLDESNGLNYWATKIFNMYEVLPCYWGFLNSLKFTNFLEIYTYSSGSVLFRCTSVIRDYLKILAVNQPTPELNCKVLFRYYVAPKVNASLYEQYGNSSELWSSYSNSYVPVNLPENMTFGWHKSKIVDWSPTLNLDFWFSSEQWIPDENQVSQIPMRPVSGASILGIEGELKILLDYSESLRFK